MWNYCFSFHFWLDNKQMKSLVVFLFTFICKSTWKITLKLIKWKQILFLFLILFSLSSTNSDFAWCFWSEIMICFLLFLFSLRLMHSFHHNCAWFHHLIIQNNTSFAKTVFLTKPSFNLQSTWKRNNSPSFCLFATILGAFESLLGILAEENNRLFVEEDGSWSNHIQTNTWKKTHFFFNPFFIFCLFHFCSLACSFPSFESTRDEVHLFVKPEQTLFWLTRKTVLFFNLENDRKKKNKK